MKDYINENAKSINRQEDEDGSLFSDRFGQIVSNSACIGK